MGHFDKRRMYQAVCSQCGANCELPFQPTPGKDVYCSACFKARRGQNDRRDDRQGGGMSGKQFDILSSKLDKIISLLSQAPQGEAMLEKLENKAKKEVKKPAAKKTPAKKPAVKKAPAKKVVAKKPAKKAKK